MKRRTFLALAPATVAALTMGKGLRPAAASSSEDPFSISLAEWSLNRTIRSGKLDNLDFPRVAKERFDIDCVEFVDQFFADKSEDKAYLGELKTRAADAGVALGLIMLDTNGALGVASPRTRNRAVEKSYRWIDAAAFLGCGSIRVNARGEKDPEELKRWMAESCATLADYAVERGINVTIENHGGPSSDPVWLTSLMATVGKPNFGTLPDFGNFPEDVDRYDAVEMMMPYAKAVSAKAVQFSAQGEITDTDFGRMMRIVRDGGYTGDVGIETSPPSADLEDKAILWTRDALRAIREEQRQCRPIFNGENLDGWTAVAGGEWTVDTGVLTGRNGKDWSTDPERTGSWLRTNEAYSDFRLELQFRINRGGNSGVFFRSATEKNPAFTGYEMQIVDGHGAEASKGGAGSIYDVIAPTENRMRPAETWNTASITALGNSITIELNGETTIETQLDRSAKGYIGLQNHDAKSVVAFKNIRLARL